MHRWNFCKFLLLRSLIQQTSNLHLHKNSKSYWKKSKKANFIKLNWNATHSTCRRQEKKNFFHCQSIRGWNEGVLYLFAQNRVFHRWCYPDYRSKIPEKPWTVDETFFFQDFIVQIANENPNGSVACSIHVESCAANEKALVIEIDGCLICQRLENCCIMSDKKRT